MHPHHWKTDYPHFDNTITMSEYLNEIMDVEWNIILQDGTYAEVTLPDGRQFELHARGDGDSYNHVIEFVEIEKS